MERKLKRMVNDDENISIFNTHGYIISLDPSLNNTGYCVAKITQQKKQKRVTIIEVGHIPNGHFESNRMGYKLIHIYRRLTQLKNTYNPFVIIKENLATNGYGQVESLATVHGIIRMVFRDIQIIGYAPNKIKKDVTGSGKAEKEDIVNSIQRYIENKYIYTDINLTQFHTTDESDALAVLLTYLLEEKI